MKITRLFSILLCVLFVISCNPGDKESIESQTVIGKWYLTKVVGGIAYREFEKEFTYLILKNDQSYAILAEDSTLSTGKYDLTIQSDTTITFTPLASERTFFEEFPKTVHFDHRKMLLVDPCCDLYTYEFGVTD